MRALLLAALGLMLIFGRPALAQQLMLNEEPRESFTGFGWTFLILSAGTLAYGLQAKSDSEEALDKADASFAQYQAAGTADETTSLRVTTNSFLNQAQTDERRANVALYLTILFGLTSYYSFFPEHLPDNTILVGPNTVTFRHRF